jgi:hypothetical protein
MAQFISVVSSVTGEIIILNADQITVIVADEERSILSMEGQMPDIPITLSMRDMITLLNPERAY